MELSTRRRHAALRRDAARTRARVVVAQPRRLITDSHGAVCRRSFMREVFRSSTRAHLLRTLRSPFPQMNRGAVAMASTQPRRDL